MFDADRDGALDAAEYDTFDATRQRDMATMSNGAASPAMEKVLAGQLRGYNEPDGDGQVTEAEFLGQSGAWIAGLDRDRDGTVSAADFGPRRN